MKNPKDRKVILRNRQRAILVVERPDFKKDVREIRKKFDIPSIGFKDQGSNSKWHNSFYASEDVYFETVWKKKSSEVRALRKDKKFKEAEDLHKELENASPINSYRIAIKNLLKAYKLPLNWEEGIRRYILFNDIDQMWLPAGVTLRGENDKDTGLERLWIGISDDTTIEDIKEAWPMIKFHQKQLHSYSSSKFHPIPKLQRDKRAYELLKDGKTLEEIGDIIQEEFGDSLDYNEINIAIKRYKKRLNIG